MKMADTAKPYRVVGDRPLLNILLYGEPGSGKTTLAASAQDHPDMKNVLVCNIEGGLLSIAHRGDIHAVDISTTEDLQAVFWELHRGAYESVKTVVIDSATELQTINLEEIVNTAMEKGKKMSRSGKERTEDDIWQEDYGRSTTQLKRLFRWFKDLEKHVIITALAKFVYPKVPEGTDLTMIEPMVVVPSLTAKLATAVMGYMDGNWYCYFDEDDGQYKMLTVKQGPYHAKTRGPHFAKALGPVVVNPNLTKIYDTYIESEVQKGANRNIAKKVKAEK